ncbi:putative disease resistance protein RGA3 [Carex rostrata]
MAGSLITSLLSRATNLLPSITASAEAPSSSSSNSKNSERERAHAIENDLERLMRTLERIKATLYDAEEREIRDRSVKLWLKELKKVAYDAEDVLSEYQYEVTRVQVETRNAYEATSSHKRKQIEHIVPIPNGTVDRLNKIRNQFDEIAKDREALQLKENDGVRRPNNKILRPPTGPMVDETNIFGRDADIQKVTDLLLSEKEKSFSVISIVGRGGLGKTTIAQLVYNDERVFRCFDLNGWVCVSEEFDVRRLIKATIEYFSKTNCGLNELSQLQEELAKTVKGKTILLVLDDVWNENHNLWESFRVPFKEARMVRILVTTRNKKVAEVMQTTTCFYPCILSEYSSWQLFEHYAFSDTCYTKPKHFLDMGREIMRKCGGLPLAVKSIASLLRHEADEEVWREILESGLWKNKESKEVIFPALQISYAHLPAHLKPCFSFCSMYPKDETLMKNDLIELWIAHGYVESRSNRKIREIGAEYYNELKGRSFLDDAFTNSKECCKLHDIIHDLARLNSENEHNSVDINQPLDIQERTVLREAYHLYVRGSIGHVNQIPQQTMKRLRTIFMESQECNRDFEYGYCTNCTKAINQNLELKENCQDCLGNVTLFNLNKFEVLRVLVLESDSLTKIPHSISELKHLTYLSIHSFRLKMLPLSIGLLYNLLVFNVICMSLEYLPENIGDLASLQFLTIKSYRLKMLPKSLCSLTNLLELAIYGDFLDCDPNGFVNFPSVATVRVYWQVRTIGWLKDTKDLKGKVSIVSLNNISDLEDVKRANLRNKCKLEVLELRWDHNFFHAFDSEDSKLTLDLIPKSLEDQILGEGEVHLPLIECLQPHPKLKVLRVGGYSSPIVPGWMTDPFSLQSIQELWLESCGYIESLPFGNLHTLKYLHITECFSIRTMKTEQLPSQLETLKISMCDHLELITGLRHLDMLETLKISFCITLKSLTMDGLELVESTELFGDFFHEIPHINRQSMSSLTRLVIENCGSLHSLPDGLIPPWPCDVRVQGCGCSDYYKSNQERMCSSSDRVIRVWR